MVKEETDARIWRPGTRALTAGLLLTVIFTAFEALAVATILPSVVRDIGGLRTYGWAFSAFMLATLVGNAVAGRATDARGPALPFVVGTLIFALGLISASAAPTMPLLIAARAFQGFGAGTIGAISYAAIGSGYTTAAQPRMLAALSSAWVVPGLLGPALAGWIADTFGWRWVFQGLAPAAIAGAALALPGLLHLGRSPADRKSAPEEGPTAILRAQADELGRGGIPAAIVLAVGAGLLLAGLDNPKHGGGLLLVGGLVLLVLALLRLLPRGTLRARSGLPAAVLVIGGTGFVFFGSEVFVPLGLTEIRGQSATFAGLPLTVGALAWTAGAWLQAHLAPHRSRRSVVTAGLLMIAVGIGATTIMLYPRIPVFFTGLSWGLASLGMGLAYSACALAILERAPLGREGATSAALQVSMNLGMALGTGISGALLAAGQARHAPLEMSLAGINLFMVATAILLGLVALTRLPPPAPPARTTKAPTADQSRSRK
jgi:MFS family permease